jgi:hypothetical protein
LNIRSVAEPGKPRRTASCPLPLRKNNVHPAFLRVPTELHAMIRPATTVQPDVAALRKPDSSGLKADELRRTVLDIIR